MKQELSFSLIIPAYNEEKYIGACLKSAIENSNGAFSEIIVVDNASTDQTAQVASAYPEVRIVHEPRKGLTRARQRGYSESKGIVLVYIDADTRPLPGWIEQIQKAFQKDPDIACISGPYQYYDLPPHAGVLIMAWNIATKLLSYFTKFLVIGGNFAIRRDVIDRMGGFDESIEFYGEDVDIGKRAHVYGKMVFSLQLTMPTSARRLKAQGFIYSGNLYAKNLFSILAYGRPATLEYEDFR